MNNIERIVPTVWIGNEKEVVELMEIFSKEGVKKLRVNCTRHAAEGYIKEIQAFYKIWGNTFDLILDMPIPKKKIRVFYEWKGQELKVAPDDIYSISKKNGLMRQHTDMYVENNNFDKLFSLPIGTVLTVGENHAVVRLEDKTEDEIFVKAMGKGIIPYGKYITAPGMKFIECEDEVIDEYVRVTEAVPCYGVALSFVESAEEVEMIRRKLGTGIRLIAKIETLKGVENIDKIMNVSDEIMIARGDLLINTGYELFARACNMLSASCEKAKKKYYIATGILESFRIENMKPSRSELCEIYNLFQYTNADMVIEHNKCRTKLQVVELLNIINKVLG